MRSAVAQDDGATDDNELSIPYVTSLPYRALPARRDQGDGAPLPGAALPNVVAQVGGGPRQGQPWAAQGPDAKCPRWTLDNAGTSDNRHSVALRDLPAQVFSSR